MGNRRIGSHMVIERKGVLGLERIGEKLGKSELCILGSIKSTVAKMSFFEKEWWWCLPRGAAADLRLRCHFQIMYHFQTLRFLIVSAGMNIEIIYDTKFIQ